jgi:hypothetical protein
MAEGWFSDGEGMTMTPMLAALDKWTRVVLVRVCMSWCTAITLFMIAAPVAAKPGSQSGSAASATKELPAVVHLLHFDGATGLATKISESDARRIIAEVNQIWAPAGISIVVASIRNDEAVSNASAIGWLTTSHDDEGPDAVLANLALIRPATVGEPGSLHIYFIGALPCNGITMLRRDDPRGRPDAVFVQDQPRLREVPGGGREPRARTLSHEIGHTLGLFHASEGNKLMSPGSTGVRLTESEIATARHSITSKPQH